MPDDLTLIAEPGCSIAGSAGVLICRVIGVKHNGDERYSGKRNGDKHFIVADGSTAALIRPCLYGAYHHIDLIEPVDGEPRDTDPPRRNLRRRGVGAVDPFRYNALI